MGPDIVACAKKSQVGVVISRHNIPYRESFCPASLIRGYSVASVIDQYQDRISEIAAYVDIELPKLIARYGDILENPRAQGTAFAFDFCDATRLSQFVAKRFQHGLLFYSAGQRTARFRLNLSFREPELNLLWQQLDRCLGEICGRSDWSQYPTIESLDQSQSIQRNYDFHLQLANSKLLRLTEKTTADQPPTTLEYLSGELRGWATTPDPQLFFSTKKTIRNTVTVSCTCNRKFTNPVGKLPWKNLICYLIIKQPSGRRQFWSFVTSKSLPWGRAENWLISNSNAG